MVKCQHRVRFAAPEVRLELHNGVASFTGDAPHCADEKLLKALGKISPAKELNRVLIFGSAFAHMHLPEIGGEFGLLVTSAGHVLVRRYHFAPRLEVSC